MDFLNHLFTELSSEHSYYLYTWLLGSFLIGWIARYFLARSKQKALNVALDKSKLELKQAKKQQTSLQGKLDLKEADYKKASLELKDKNALVESLGTEKRQMNTRLKSTLGDFEKVKVEHTQTTARLEELNDQILGLRTKNAQLNTEIQQSNQKINQYADTQSSAEEQQELRNIIKRLQTENSTLKKQSASVAPVAVTNEDYEAKLSDAKAEIAQLEEGNEALSNSLNTLVEQNAAMQEQLEQLPQYEEGNAALNASILQLIEQNEALKAQVNDLNQLESGNEILNSTISQLIEENDSLKVNVPTEANAVVSAIPTAMSPEELDTEQAKAEIRAAIGKQISAVAASEKDDLKKINGIGPFIEEKLNDLGIYTFHQVSQLDGLVPVLTTAIEFFPGRIERDEWIGQADRMAFMKKSSSSRRRAVKAATPAPTENFTTEKTAVQEKIIVGNKPIKRVIRRAPIRRVIKAEPSVQKVETKAAPKVELPTVPVPPVEKITPPPAPTTSLKSAVSRTIVAPPVAKAAVPDSQIAERKAAEERAAAERKAAEERAAAERKAAEERVAAEKKAAEERAAAEKKAAEERVAAEKKVAEERAAAEKKAAEERAAVEKKAAEEKAAAEKKAEEERVAAERKAAEERAAAVTPVADDLKKIEGIGPKLSKVLNNAGIINFKQLADKSTSELQDILDDAGPRYRIARPKSWPLQAAMAAAGEWDKLKDFQTEMRGGILPD